MDLCLHVLGPFQALLEGIPATFATDHARALLAYLSVEAGRPHRRAGLAGLLWPDSPESLARRNLSQTLVRLRRAIGDYRADPRYLAITGKALQLNTATVQLDLARFEELLAACAAHRHTSPVDCLPCVQRLESAAQLYRGDFLQGFFLAGSELYQEWALVKREQLHRRALGALHTLTIHYADRADYDQADRYAARQLALEPWREAAHRQRMRALTLGGQRDAALAQYHACRRVLADQLDAEPTSETTALYEQIRRGQSVQSFEKPQDPDSVTGVGSGPQRDLDGVSTGARPSAFTSEFKFRIVMDLLTGQKERVELLRTHNLANSTLESWLQEFHDRGPKIFDGPETVVGKRGSRSRIG